MRDDRAGRLVVARGGPDQRGYQRPEPHLGVIVGVARNRPVLADPAVQVRATQRRGVGRGDADEVARVRERGVSEGIGVPYGSRSTTSKTFSYSRALTSRWTVSPSRSLAARFSAASSTASGSTSAQVVSYPRRRRADAPNPRGRHRVEVRRRALARGRGTREAPRQSRRVQLLRGVEEDPPPVPSLAPSRASGTETVRPPSSMSIPRVRLSTTKDPLRVSCGSITRPVRPRSGNFSPSERKEEYTYDYDMEPTSEHRRRSDTRTRRIPSGGPTDDGKPRPRGRAHRQPTVR